MKEYPPMDPENDFPNDCEVVCPHCLHANPPETAFCQACGAPIGMVANVDPIQSIYAEGFGYRSAAEGPPRLILLIGMWLIFLPMAGISLLGILGARGFSLLMPFLFVISVGILYRVTRNHVVKTRAAKKDPEE